MKCNKCKDTQLRVIRTVRYGNETERTLICLKCGAVYHTEEKPIKK